VNWSRVSRPTSLGCLGIPDIERQGLALRIRWLWLSRTDDSRAWSGLDLHFSSQERALFQASTTRAVGNGQKVLFWEDRWINGEAVSDIAPDLYKCIPKRRRKIGTVAQGLLANSWARDIHGTIGLHEIGQYIQLWRILQNTALNNEEDQAI
jgi:hypothetical protein